MDWTIKATLITSLVTLNTLFQECEKLLFVVKNRRLSRKSTWEKYFNFLLKWFEKSKLHQDKAEAGGCELFVTNSLWNEIIFLYDQSSNQHHVDYLTVQLNCNCCWWYRLRDKKQPQPPLKLIIIGFNSVIFLISTTNIQHQTKCEYFSARFKATVNMGK